jgi:hypothetical protein
VQIFPAEVIETLGVATEVLVGESFGFLDVFGSKNPAGKVCLDDVLESGDFGVIEETAARADVGIDEARVRRILPPMGELVAIGIEDRVEAKGLNIDLLADSAAPLQ